MKPHRIGILLIEDNPSDHFFIKRMLTQASGYIYHFDLFHADHLAQGLTRLKQDDITIIVLDLSLPDSQGLETFLKVHEEAPDMPIVVFSGHDDEILAAKAVAMGAQDYLVKGRVDQDLLTRSVIYAIERKQAETEARASERHQAGEALKASEARYRDIIEKNADSILIVDVEGSIRFVNPATEVLFGCPAQTLLFTPCDFPLIVGQKTEITITRRDGSNDMVVAEVHLVETEWEGKTTYLASLRDVTERVRAQQALRESELRYRAVVEDQTELICRFRPDGSLTFVNQVYCRYFGQEREAMLGQSFLAPMRPEDQAGATQQMATLNWDDAAISFKHACLDGDQRPRWLQWTIRALPDEQGKLTKYQAVGRDITAQIQVEETLTKLSRVVEQTADNVMITDETGIIEYINPAFAAHTGYGQQEAIGYKPNILKSGKHNPQLYQKLWETILSGQAYIGTIINKKKSGELYYEAVTITPIKDATGRITHFVSTGKDITERKRAEEILRHEATHDAMTGLPNRALFIRRLEQALIQAISDDRRQFAVLFLDLDRFKIINDSLGHMIGDHLLIAVARRLESCLRASDTVARIGGDEFTILLDGISSVDDAIQAVNRIQAKLSLPINLYGHEVFTTASIGITLSSLGYTLPEALLRDADAAMYQAKTLGKARSEFYDFSVRKPMASRLQLDTDLRHAIERQEFQLYYQPIVSLESGQITGMEALVRWHHPERGLISPGEFIPLAEETGLIVAIGEWVLRTACQQNKIWQTIGYTRLRVAVNISARQFQRQNLLPLIDQILMETSLAPENLELEITESVEMMRHLNLNTATLKSLNALGIGISIDDFGNQYSSLVYLKQFPINVLKIDKCFIDDVAYDADAAAITAGIITMAHNLRLKVIAEGVETVAQLNCLRLQQCDEIQGYFFSKPVTAETATELLQQNRLSFPKIISDLD